MFQLGNSIGFPSGTLIVLQYPYVYFRTVKTLWNLNWSNTTSIGGLGVGSGWSIRVRHHKQSFSFSFAWIWQNKQLLSIGFSNCLIPWEYVFHVKSIEVMVLCIHNTYNHYITSVLSSASMHTITLWGIHRYLQLGAAMHSGIPPFIIVK